MLADPVNTPDPNRITFFEDLMVLAEANDEKVTAVLISKMKIIKPFKAITIWWKLRNPFFTMLINPIANRSYSSHAVSSSEPSVLQN